MEITLDFTKGNGLIPVIIQDTKTLKVLMQAYMNQEAYDQTVSTGRVTFYSRSKDRLWTKGETSGNYLDVKEITADCDNDSLLIKVEPHGPSCHTGAVSCFYNNIEANESAKGTSLLEELTFIDYLEGLLLSRKNEDPEKSYTAKLFEAGLKRIAKKLGEEAVEVALEAEHGDPERFTEEAADLIYHFTVLLLAKGLGWSEVIAELKKRHG